MILRIKFAFYLGSICNFLLGMLFFYPIIRNFKNKEKKKVSLILSFLFFSIYCLTISFIYIFSFINRNISEINSSMLLNLVWISSNSYVIFYSHYINSVLFKGTKKLIDIFHVVIIFLITGFSIGNINNISANWNEGAVVIVFNNSELIPSYIIYGILAINLIVLLYQIFKITYIQKDKIEKSENLILAEYNHKLNEIFRFLQSIISILILFYLPTTSESQIMNEVLVKIIGYCTFIYFYWQNSFFLFELKDEKNLIDFFVLAENEDDMRIIMKKQDKYQNKILIFTFFLITLFFISDLGNFSLEFEHSDDLLNSGFGLFLFNLKSKQIFLNYIGFIPGFIFFIILSLNSFKKFNYIFIQTILCFIIQFIILITLWFIFGGDVIKDPLFPFSGIILPIFIISLISLRKIYNRKKIHQFSKNPALISANASFISTFLILLFYDIILSTSPTSKIIVAGEGLSDGIFIYPLMIYLLLNFLINFIFVLLPGIIINKEEENKK